MYAIVEIAGQQFKVEKGQEIYVHRLENPEGDKVRFDSVMMIDNNGKLNIGTPVISGAQVTATIMEHMKGDKVLIFHKKRRKGYQKLNGHREYLSLIKIDEIIESGATPEKKEEKKSEIKKSAPKKKPAAKKAEVAGKKEATTKKTSAKAKKEEEATVAKAEAKPLADKKAEVAADETAKPDAKKSVEGKKEEKEEAKAQKEEAKAQKEEAKAQKEDEKEGKTEKTEKSSKKEAGETSSEEKK